MREVTKEEFFRYIGELTVDVHPRILPGDYPWTSSFRDRNGTEHGRIVGVWKYPEFACGLTRDEFYLPEHAAASPH